MARKVLLVVAKSLNLINIGTNPTSTTIKYQSFSVTDKTQAVAEYLNANCATRCMLGSCFQ